MATVCIGFWLLLWRQDSEKVAQEAPQCPGLYPTFVGCGLCSCAVLELGVRPWVFWALPSCVSFGLLAGEAFYIAHVKEDDYDSV